MKQGLLSKMFGFPAGLETQARDKLLAGFFLLLMLIGFTGYWGLRKLQDVEGRTADMRATNAHHLKIAISISRVVGEMAPEVRAEIGTSATSPLLHFPALKHLQEL